MTFKVICRKEIIYKNSTSPLCLLFFQGKRKKAVELGVSVALKHWDAEAQKVTDDCPDRDNIQFQITAKIKEYEKKIQRLEVMDIPVTFENLFEQSSKRLNCSIGEYLKQTIERLETLGKYGSASKHRSLLSRLSEFRSLNTRFDEIDLAFLRDFELFLRKEGNANNSIATKFAIFKAAYNKALAEGLFIQKVNPFAKYKVGSLWTRTRKRAIAKEDIQKLVALEIATNYRTNYAECMDRAFSYSPTTPDEPYFTMKTFGSKRYGRPPSLMAAYRTDGINGCMITFRSPARLILNIGIGALPIPIFFQKTALCPYFAPGHSATSPRRRAARTKYSGMQASSSSHLGVLASSRRPDQSL